MTAPLLSVSDLQLYFVQRYGVFKQHKSYVRAVDGVSFEILPGETLGLVGESGCGKSSLGKALLNLHRPTGGSIEFHGRQLAGLQEKHLRPLRAKMQMVFQDPFDSLNARHTVEHILEEPLIVHRRGSAAQRKARVRELIDLVGLDAAALNKYPHEFSGGQRQRIGIARAIALEPELLVCDEAVSALDVSVQAQIINLLLKIQRQMGLAMLFISHDLSVVRHISDRIAVMYQGRLVEVGDSAALCEHPAHPYTRALLDAVPRFGRPWESLRVLGGEVAEQTTHIGCAFRSRCPRAGELCARVEPPLERHDSHGEPRWAACHFPEP